MKLTPEHKDQEINNLVTAYERGSVRVNETVYKASIIIAARQIVADWQPAGFDDLEWEHFSAVLAFEPEIVILGTGEKHRFPDHSILLKLLEHGASLESMDTQAACRTFNVLRGEGRNVVAALLLGN